MDYKLLPYNLAIPDSDGFETGRLRMARALKQILKDKKTYVGGH